MDDVFNQYLTYNMWAAWLRFVVLRIDESYVRIIIIVRHLI